MQAPTPDAGDSGIPGLRSQWEHFPHEADMGVRGCGDTLAEAFAAAAEAMIAVVTDPAGVRPEVHVGISCSAPDREVLLYDFLNAIVYEMAVSGLLLSRFRVHIDGTQLRAEAWGERTERARHRPAVEIKGATFTQLAVRQMGDGSWVAQCVLDI